MSLREILAAAEEQSQKWQHEVKCRPRQRCVQGPQKQVKEKLDSDTGLILMICQEYPFLLGLNMDYFSHTKGKYFSNSE